MKTRIFALAALLVAASDLRAQSPDAALPACAEGGLSRLAVTVPPGQTREEMIQALQQSGALPEGTQVKILAEHERPEMVNYDRFISRWQMHMGRLLRSGLEVDGSAATLLRVDADGVVVEAHPATGHRDVDRGLRDLWRHARYAPVVVGGCRVPAWLHVGLDFESEYRHWQRSVQTRIHQ